MSLLVISQTEVADLLPMDECIGLMRNAFEAMATGEVVLPLRPVMPLPDRRGVLAMMPGYVADPETVAAKVITVFPGNLGTPYDAHQGAVLLFDPRNGRLVGLVDASEVTAIRTAAASAVATDLLARHDAGHLAILGSGVQAHRHLDAMRVVRSINSVRVWSRSAEHARTFARREAQRLMIDVEVTDSVEEAIRTADIICTTTTARSPIVLGEWISEGTHINAVGSCSPKTREVDTSAIIKSRLYVDWLESALKEAGDIIIPMQDGAIDENDIEGEIGRVILGSVEGRRNETEITLFKSLGVAIQDAVVAQHLYGKARERRVGTKLEFGGAR